MFRVWPALLMQTLCVCPSAWAQFSTISLRGVVLFQVLAALPMLHACLSAQTRKKKAQTQIPGLRSLSYLAQENRAKSQFLPTVDRPVLHMREHCPVSQHCLQDNHGKACIWNEGLSIVQDSATTCRQELNVGITLLHRTTQQSVGRELGLQYKMHICSPVRDK